MNNYSKFFLLPLFLALGVDVAWLDLDIFVIRNPTWRFMKIAYESDFDVLTTDHWGANCLNHGVFFVTASDRTLLWSLRYIRWLHENPFGHDQNGWDAFVRHSILAEPLVPDDVHLG